MQTQTQNLSVEDRELIAADLENVKVYALKTRQYRMHSAVADAIAQLRA